MSIYRSVFSTEIVVLSSPLVYDLLFLVKYDVRLHITRVYPVVFVLDTGKSWFLPLLKRECIVKLFCR